MQQKIMITAYSFGTICINGTWHRRDLRISGETIHPDWWRKRGHACDIEDVEELLAGAPDILILGQGTPGMMHATPELRQYLRQQGIKLIEQSTAEAITTFNDLYRQKNIVAGFHLTC